MNQRRIGVLLSYANMVAKNLVAFIYLPFLIRFLGQSEYGLYQMANSIIGTLSILSLGFGSAYIRFYARAKQTGKNTEVAKLNGLYLLIFSIASVLSIVVGMILIINIHSLFHQSLSPAEVRTTEKLMMLMVLNVAITFISSIFDSYIMANQEFRFQRSRQLGQTIMAPIMTLPFLFLGYKAISVVIVQTLIYVVFLFLNINFAIKKLRMKFQFRGLSLGQFREIAIFSIYILANEITDQINWNLPNFLLGMLSGAKSVAIFGIASQIKTVFINLSTTLSGVFIPQINNVVAESNDNTVLTDIMSKVGRLQTLIVLYIFGGFLILGPFFIHVWAGNGYSQVYVLSILLIIPLLIPLIQNVGIEIQRAKNLHRFRSIVYVIFAVLNVGITYILINQIGIYGAAIGGVITMSISNGVLMNWYYAKKVNLDMRTFWINIIPFIIPWGIASGVGWVLSYFMEVRSVTVFILYGFIYTLIYFGIYFRCTANEREKKWFSQILGKHLKFRNGGK